MGTRSSSLEPVRLSPPCLDALKFEFEKREKEKCLNLKKALVLFKVECRKASSRIRGNWQTVWFGNSGNSMRIVRRFFRFFKALKKPENWLAAEVVVLKCGDYAHQTPIFSANC